MHLMKSGILLFVLALTTTISIAGEVTVNIRWKYQGLDGKMQLYHIDNSRKTWLWRTLAVQKLSDVPKKQLIDGTIKLKKGGHKNLLLVYHNRSKKPVYFFAAPHNMKPAYNALGFKFHCLCINHAFKVPPGHYWYRVVRLTVSPWLEGDQLDVTHTLVAIGKSRMEKFQLKK